MKYLIVEDFAGKPIPIIFPRRIDHADMLEQLPYGKVISAGVVELGDDGLRCHGGNVELGLKALPGDKDVIREALRVRSDTF